jgi:hypothetical protein
MAISTMTLSPPREQTLADALSNVVRFVDDASQQLDAAQSRLVSAVSVALKSDKALAVAAADNAKQAALVACRTAFIENGDAVAYTAASTKIEADHSAAIAAIDANVMRQLSEWQQTFQKAVAGHNMASQGLMGAVEDAVTKEAA